MYKLHTMADIFIITILNKTNFAADACSLYHIATHQPTVLFTYPWFSPQAYGTGISAVHTKAVISNISSSSSSPLPILFLCQHHHPLSLSFYPLLYPTHCLSGYICEYKPQASETWICQKVLLYMHFILNFFTANKVLKQSRRLSVQSDIYLCYEP